jgi:hypothetical protein
MPSAGWRALGAVLFLFVVVLGFGLGAFLGLLGAFWSGLIPPIRC